MRAFKGPGAVQGELIVAWLEVVQVHYIRSTPLTQVH